MGIWDDLMNRLRKTGDTVKQEASRRAAQAALDQFKKRVSSAADSFLDGAEAELEQAQAARQGRTEYRPSEAPSTADDVISQASALEAAHKQRAPTNRPATSYAEQKAARKARAQAELEALKQKLQDNDS